MNKKKKDFLKNEPLVKLLFSQSVPAIVGMFVMALYNVVDTFFVGQIVGVEAIAALSISFPVSIFIMAFAQLSGIGGASVISRNLGAGNIKKARITAANALLFVFVSAVVIAFFGVLFCKEIMSALGADSNIIGYAQDYMYITFPGAVTFMLTVCINNLIRAEGHAKTAMFTMTLSALLNIALDAVFMISLNAGVKGAAVATVISQFAVICYAVYHFKFSGKSNLVPSLSDFKFDKKILFEIWGIGFSSFMRQASGSLIAIIINKSIVSYGSNIELAAFGIINRIQSFAFMPTFGIVQGMSPIAGYNYGAKRFDRVKKSYFISMGTSTTLFISMFIFFIFKSSFLIEIFNSNPNLIKSGSEALKIISLMFPLLGFQIVGGGLFQALGKVKPALITTISRQIIFFIPLIIFLPRIFGLRGIWFSFPIADMLSVILTLFYIVKEIKLLTKFQNQQQQTL